MKLVIAILCVLSVHLIVGEVCPGGTGTCPPRMTCCELPSGKEGCCPYQNATCCPDKVHCCPYGFDCGTSRCEKRDDNTVLEPRKLIVEIQEEHTNASANSVICPDFSRCADDETCCLMDKGEYGCCPLAAAVCCNDHKTCCPHGTVCTGGGGCEGKETVKRVKISPKSVVCPGGRFKCPDYNTCCLMPGGHYGCCPLYHAVCCHDGRHCCPSGYTCDTYSAQCHRN